MMTKDLTNGWLIRCEGATDDVNHRIESSAKKILGKRKN